MPQLIRLVVFAGSVRPEHSAVGHALPLAGRALSSADSSSRRATKSGVCGSAEWSAPSEATMPMASLTW